MKIVKNFAFAAAMIAAVSSCQTVKISAPAGSNVVLASESEQLPLITKKKEFFLLGGLIPLNNMKTEAAIAENGLKKVKVDTRYNLVDIIVGAVTFNIIHLRTTRVYGSK